MVLENKKRAELVKRQAAQKKAEKTLTTKETVQKYVVEAKREVQQVRLFLRKSTKPDMREYRHLLRAHTTGILLLGFLGYAVTFVHIPINNILFGVKK